MTFYGPDQLGRACPTCGARVPLAIQSNFHPTCHPQDRATFPELVAYLAVGVLLALVPVVLLIQGSSPA